MPPIDLPRPKDLDVDVRLPDELARIVAQNLIDLTPWHIMPRELALTRIASLRGRYGTRYVPFARRQDNDDLACLDPGLPGQVVVVHDYATDGAERVAAFPTFWDWFRAAIEDMVEFDR